MLAGLAASAPLLVLIDSEHAGPQVDPAAYRHKLMVGWPLQEERWLPTLIAGAVWQPSESGRRPLVGQAREAGFFPPKIAIAFDPRRAEVPELKNLVESARVYVSAEDAIADREADVAILSSSDWGEIAKWAAICRDRVLVLEYPPSHGSSRYWLRGIGWPRGVPAPNSSAPGALDAADALRAVVAPSQVAWAEEPAIAASAKFDHAQRSGETVLAVLGLLIAYVVGCAGYTAGNERLARFARACLRAAAIALPSIAVEGTVARWLDYPSAWFSLPCALLIAVSMATLVGRMTRHWFTDGWLSGIALSSVVLALAGTWRGGIVDPGLLGSPQASEAIPLAGLLISLAMLEFAGPNELAGRISAVGSIAIACCSLLPAVWWHDASGVGAVLLALVGWLTHTRFNSAVGFLMAAYPLLWFQLFRHGGTTTAAGGVREAAEVAATRFDEWSRWSRDLVLASVVGLGSVAALVGGRYLLSRVQRSFEARASLRALAAAAIAALIASVGFSSNLQCVTVLLIGLVFLVSLSVVTDLEPTLK